MSFKLRLLLLAVVAGMVIPTILWMKPFPATSRSHRQQIAADSVVRYASDDFVAACIVRPKALIEHPYFGSLPIDAVLPDPLSLSRLDAMGVEEFVVFCGPASEQPSTPARQSGAGWAAAARLSRSLDLETIRTQWRRSLVHKEQDEDSQPEPITIGGFSCYRVPAGTFFPRERTYGQLRFLGRDGLHAERGINVGKVYTYRGYVEGGSKSAAIFTFDQLDETDLVAGRLPLELRLDVFHTRFLDEEYCTAQIELRNPETGLKSEPIPFQPKSYVNHEFDISPELTAVDARGPRRAGLLQDFVSSGRMEVILKLDEPATYLGVGKYDLNVRRTAFEYVFVADREIVVAQSSHTLQAMLTAAAAPTALAQRLSEANADIAVIARARNSTERTAFRRMVGAIGDDPLLVLAGDGLTDLLATAHVAEPAAVRVAAEFTHHKIARRAKEAFQQRIQSTKAETKEGIKDSLNMIDTIGALLSMVSDGISMHFPDLDSPDAEARQAEMSSLINECLDHFHARLNGQVLTVQWEQPARLAQLSKAGQFAMANMEEALARDLFSRERFDLEDAMYERVTDRFPHVPQAWFRRAHQLSYNTSVEFDGYESRYVWVGRGVDVLLDGMEQNPHSTDLTWMAARFIGWKIGSADERIFYRELFARDERLHERISKLVDLEAARSPDGKVDNWLVAKLLFEQCVDREAKRATPSAIPPLVFFSRPAAAQAGYAQALSEAGQWTQALQAWKQAEQLYKEFGDRTIPMRAAEAIRLNDLEARVAQFGRDDPTAKHLQVARNSIQYDYWLQRCKLEQTTQLQLARQLWQDAERARRSEPRKAYDAYRQSLEAISEAKDLYPTQMALVVGEFWRLARNYRSIAEQLAVTGDAPAILNLIEKSKPISRLPLVDLPSAAGQSNLPNRDN